MNERSRRRVLRPALIAVLSLAGAAPISSPEAQIDPAADRPDWIRIDYADLIDRRELSHSGESVGVLLDKLGGRPAPSAGERPADRVTHVLLDPLLEPYAFVLPDALDSLVAVPPAPYMEVGSLWDPGEPQPAWVELLRARRYVVESDGAGNLRACLPWPAGPSAGQQPQIKSTAAAREAWRAAWPVVRHVLAAERRRLSSSGSQQPTLQVRVHAYRHWPELSVFQLGTRPEQITVDDTRPDGLRPPLELDRIRQFLDAGLLLEGGRLDQDGALRLLGSPTSQPVGLLGRSLGLSDFAVAYRAVFHGGLARPYMSLDRGYAPQRSIVSYGGRLRDTALGQVSLLCDIRFKTFSVGLDIVRGADLRETLRGALPGFRSHLERFAAHPDSKGLAGQQTRLWFYPDDVDLTLSAQADVLVMRKVRMSAASERLEGLGGAAQGVEDRPWTRTTVDAINRDYDALTGFFPEMADLDQVVRLLSLFTWLRQAAVDGHGVPELDTLLDFELPQLATPRSYPQLLAFNALPPPGSGVPVEVFDRVVIAEALDRLNPSSGRPLGARRRYQRAVSALDPQQPDHAALLNEFEPFDVERLDDDRLDLLSHRAERVRMHQLVLATLEPEHSRDLAERLRQGEELRIFSVGIGGLDLDMGQVLARAQGRSLGLAADDLPAGGRRREDPRSVSERRGATGEPRGSWRRDPEGLPANVLPEHGLGQAAAGPARRLGGHLVEVGSAKGEGGEDESRWVLTVYGADGPEVRSRRLLLDSRGRASSIERVEQLRLLRYRFEQDGAALVARRVEPSPPSSELAAPGQGLPPTLAALQVVPPPTGPIESRGVVLRLESSAGGSSRTLEAEFPRPLLQRLVLGRDADRTPGRPLSGLAPLPDALGEVESLMVMPLASHWLAPWEFDQPVLAGEEDPVRLARALQDWWAASAPPAPAAVVGVDPVRSPGRWETAPPPGSDATLLLPDPASAGPWSATRTELSRAWQPGPVVQALPERVESALVVLVSAEPPGTCARRMRELARDPRMNGRLLAAWCLAGLVRPDLAGSLLGEDRLAGLGLAEASVVGDRRAVEWIAALRQALTQTDPQPIRPERLPGPFLWHY